jgi:hypothetical protein
MDTTVTESPISANSSNAERYQKADRVSVVVPTFHRPLLLRDALRSIRAVQGTDLDIEIIVVDNAGTECEPNIEKCLKDGAA